MAKEPNPWEEQWRIIDSLPGGGQCLNYKVINRDNEGEVFVLKVIKDKSKKERRARFYREVHNYISLNSPYFPDIVSHNCNETPAVEKKLYLIYRFIEGINLEQFINENGRLPLNDAVKFLLLLINILETCHQNDIIHRDIKPDNILLKDGDINQPVLIDFGLSANEADENESELVQLGNRFLHLHELKHTKGNKRDKRSDIAYLVGILYYVLTAKQPEVLLDEDNRYPHQRIDLSSIIIETTPSQLAVLLKTFDIGFQHQLNSRFQSLEHLKDYLTRILMAEKEKEFDFEQFLKDSADDSSRRVEDSLNSMYPEFRSIFSLLPTKIGANFRDIEVAFSGPSILSHWQPMCIGGHYTLTEKYKRDVQRTYMLKLYPNGVEYLLSVFIDKEEITIERFQDFQALDKEDAFSKIYNTIMQDFALLKRENLGKQT